MTHAVELYTVRGRWPFPEDMLRRDRSIPATPEAAEAIARLTRDHCDDMADVREIVDIQLQMETPDRFGPNEARWRSFQWQVVSPDDLAMEADTLKDRMAVLRRNALQKLTSEEIEALKWHGLDERH